MTTSIIFLFILVILIIASWPELKKLTEIDTLDKSQ